MYGIGNKLAAMSMNCHLKRKMPPYSAPKLSREYTIQFWAYLLGMHSHWGSSMMLGLSCDSSMAWRIAECADVPESM